MYIQQVIEAFKDKEDVPCTITERLVTSGYQQRYGGYIKKAQSLGLEVAFRKNLPSQYWHLMSYCETKDHEDVFSRRIVCGELLFWMAEALECVPEEELNALADSILASGHQVGDGRPVFDRMACNRMIQDVCFQRISDEVIKKCRNDGFFTDTI